MDELIIGNERYYRPKFTEAATVFKKMQLSSEKRTILNKSSADNLDELTNKLKLETLQEKAEDILKYIPQSLQEALNSILTNTAEENLDELEEILKKYREELDTKYTYFKDLDYLKARKLIMTAVTTYCGNDSDIDEIFNTVIPKEGKHKIVIQGNLNNVRGALGEIRTILILKKLFPGYKVSPNGVQGVNIGNTKNKESPIDAIVEVLKEKEKEFEIGFQTKNTLSSTYSWTNDDSMNITNFYTQRLNSGTDITPQAEKDFFSVYSYNRPIDGCDSKYREAYDRFKNNPYFIQKFNSLAYKVIR